MRDRLAGIDLAKNWTNVAVSLKEKKRIGGAAMALRVLGVLACCYLVCYACLL
jgi:hypothetical protein